MIKIEELPNNVVAAEVSGKVTVDDYKDYEPRVEKAIDERGKLNMVFMLHDFEGFKPGAMLEEIRFDMHHRKDFNRLAVVGHTRKQKWGTRLSAPFFTGEVRYFEENEVDKARDWINEPAHEV